MQEMHKELKAAGDHLGMKICGAGGGGCFLLTHRAEDRAMIDQLIMKYNMKKLDFVVEQPL
jgi:D-glycero-alpha-D-manno-heptose-7-phosphate kinase